MKRIIHTVLATAALASAGHVVAAGDPAAGKALYAVCTACHGANGEGNAALKAPRLAGQDVAYVTRQLTAFKSGLRGSNPKDVTGAQMRPMAMTLADDAAIANVAAYVGTLQGPKAAPTVAGDAAAGKALYAVCATCHGPNGEGMAAMNGPRLAGQDDWYLVSSLQAFRSGIRGADPKDTLGAQMRPMAMTLANDKAVNDVVAYINTLGK
jgi:cytochrome c oxidase subunit 2